jgi:large subunit ribosomal protein LP1
MSNTNKAEQAVAYAALILADESIAITPEKLQALLKAAGIEDVEPIWTTIFANALKDKDVKEILTTVAATEPTVGGEGPDRGGLDDTDCDDNDDNFDDTVTLFDGESSDGEAFCSMFD